MAHIRIRMVNLIIIDQVNHHKSWQVTWKHGTKCQLLVGWATQVLNFSFAQYTTRHSFLCNATYCKLAESCI